MIRGYVTSRAFGGLVIPVPAQNSVLREYAKARNVNYVLPFLEHKFDNCYMQLFSVIETAHTGDCVAMYSVSMLPYMDNTKLELIDNAVARSGCELHFALEGVTTRSLKYVSKLISSYKIRDILDESNRLSVKQLRSMYEDVRVLSA
jgi:sporadic carbohydrate cluster protein (TIGR04323 family)